MFIGYHLFLLGIATVFTILSFGTKAQSYSAPDAEDESKSRHTADLEYFNNPAYALFAWIFWFINAVYVGQLTFVYAQFDTIWQTYILYYDALYPLTYLYYGLGIICFLMFIYNFYLWLMGKVKHI